MAGRKAQDKSSESASKTLGGAEVVDEVGEAFTADQMAQIESGEYPTPAQGEADADAEAKTRTEGDS